MNTNDGFTLYHKIIKFRPGMWYFEVWACKEGKEQKIRPGMNPYKTKREAIEQAEDMVKYFVKQRNECLTHRSS